MERRQVIVWGLQKEERTKWIQQKRSVVVLHKLVRCELCKGTPCKGHV